MKLTRIVLAVFLLFSVSLITGCEDDCVGTVGTSCNSDSGEGGGGTVIDGKLIAMDITVDKTSLKGGESASILITFVDDKNTPQSGSASVTVTSLCLISGLASVSGATSSADGGITLSYKANGCKDDDTVSIEGIFKETEFPEQKIKFTLLEDVVTFIQWVSTVPEQLAIKGSGGQETAVVTFRLNGESGANVIGEEVVFSVAGKAGGLVLVNGSAISDSDGLVKAVVQAGSFPSTPTIVATHLASGVSTPSGGLVVANGLASDTNFNIALSFSNPHAWNWINHDGVDVTVAVNDKAGNKVADGTVVNFVAENGYGIIEESCDVSGGLCSVGWIPNGKNAPDGRVKLFATVKGTEDFIDNNGNLVFDDADTFVPLIHDRAEPYADWNDNGKYDLGEYFVDTNLDGVRSPGDGLWNGLNCAHSNLCGDNAIVDLGVQIQMVQSDDTPMFCSEGNLSSFIINKNQTVDISGIVLCDLNGNSLPHGTTYSFTSTVGKVIGGSGEIADNETGPHFVEEAGFTAPDITDGKPKSGELTFTIRTHELVKSYIFSITVTE